MMPDGIVKLSRFGRDGVQRARLHAAAVALRHCAAGHRVILTKPDNAITARLRQIINPR